MNHRARLATGIVSVAVFAMHLHAASAQPTGPADGGAGSGSAGTGSDAGSAAPVPPGSDQPGANGAAPAAAAGNCNRGAATAATDKPNEKATVDVPLINSAVPDAPAFSFLGVTPTQISAPQTARELGSAAASVIGLDGKFHQGVAIEWTPYKTLGSPTLDDYEELYFAHNFQVSFATSQGVGAGTTAAGAEATETDGALGARTTIWNPDDPVIALKRRYLDDVTTARELAGIYNSVGPPTDVGKAIGFCKILRDARAGIARDGSTGHQDLIAAATKLDAQDKALATAEADLKKKWNQTAFAVGAALGGLAPDSLWKSLGFRGWAAWGTLSYGFGTFGQIVVTGRYHSDAKAATPGDTSMAGGHLAFGNASFATFGEFSWNWLKPSTDAVKKDNWGQATVGIELKVGDKTWLVAAFGGTFLKTDEKNDFFAASNFKWSFGDKTMPMGPIR